MSLTPPGPTDALTTPVVKGAPFASAPVRHAGPRMLRVISWNIYRNARPHKIRQSLERFVHELAPDVLLIQEAPWAGALVLAEFAAFEGYYQAYEPMHFLRAEDGTERTVGQLTASVEPFTAVTGHVLPPARLAFGRSESERAEVRRVALYTQLKLPDGEHVGLYNVHLENRAFPRGRRRQIEYLIDVIDDRRDRIVVIGGDLNTFFPEALETSLPLFEEAGFVNLFRDERLRLLPRLDYFMVRGAQSARTVPLRGNGSDHQPIMADIHI